MQDKIEFLKKLGYTVEERTYIDWEHETRSSEEWEEDYTVTVAYKEDPEEKYKNGKYLQKRKFESSGIAFFTVYRNEYQKALDNLVHNSI